MHTHTPTDDQPVESKHSLEQLLRRHVQGTLHVSDTASSAAQLSRSSAVTSSGKTVWPALPKCPQLLSESTKRPECVSKKVTSAHKAIIEERDKFFNVSEIISFCYYIFCLYILY